MKRTAGDSKWYPEQDHNIPPSRIPPLASHLAVIPPPLPPPQLFNLYSQKPSLLPAD